MAAQKKLHPLIFIVLGLIVAGFSFYFNYFRDKNLWGKMTIFFAIGSLMLLYGFVGYGIKKLTEKPQQKMHIAGSAAAAAHGHNVHPNIPAQHSSHPGVQHTQHVSHAHVAPNFCPGCGERLMSHSAFCQTCGRKVH